MENWKKLVIENQDKIIITVTHPALYGTTEDSKKNKSAHIPHSKRFIDILKKYKHDIWIHGHVAYNITDKNSEDIVEKYGSLHMNVGLHIPYVFATEKFDVSSKFIIFTNNSNKVIIKSRNHIKNKWIKNEERTYILHTKAELSSEPVFDGRYAFDPDHGIITEPLHLFSEVENPNANGISNTISRPCIHKIRKTRILDRSYAIIIYWKSRNWHPKTSRRTSYICK